MTPPYITPYTGQIKGGYNRINSSCYPGNSFRMQGIKSKKKSSKPAPLVECHFAVFAFLIGQFRNNATEKNTCGKQESNVCNSEPEPVFTPNNVITIVEYGNQRAVIERAFIIKPG